MGEIHTGFRIPCDSCSDIFLTPESLKEHETEMNKAEMHETHSWEEEDYNFKCEYCEKGFQERKQIMIHIQCDHSEKVKLCKHFVEGRCIFGEDSWFLHDQSRQIEKIKCMFCEHSFDSKHELMNHRKKDHPTRVKQCNNEENGNCQHGPRLCWYNHNKKHEVDVHESIQLEQNIQANDMMQKLFDMMENVCHRLVVIESERN